MNREELRQRLEEMAPGRRAMLEKMLLLRAPIARPSIPPRPPQPVHPLSFSQERLWFLQQMDPTGGSLNRPVAVRLTGELDVALLEQSLTEISKRHDILRVTFDETEGAPQQRIAAVCPIRLRVEDCSDLVLDACILRTQTVLREGVREPFDLSAGPIVRGTVVRWGTTEHVLLLVTHQIVFDAWSAEILINELFTLYGQLSRGCPPQLTALPISYVDYTHWEREQFELGAFDESLAFWVEALQDLPDRVKLPTDRQRQRMEPDRPACERLRLHQNLVRNLESLAEKERTTLFSFLLAGFALMIRRYTGAEDLLIGTPVTERANPETEDLIGPFVNTVALRCDVSGDPSGLELVGRIHRTVLSALVHRQAPFQKVVEAVHRHRRLGLAPLFDIVFNLENVPRRPVSLSGLTVEPYATEVAALGIDLLAELRKEPEGGLTCEFAYRSSLFDRKTIQRALTHYETLLTGIAEEPRRPISSIPMLPVTERHRLLVEWNDTRHAYPMHRCVHELFEAQATRTPDRIAVVCGTESVSYRELADRAEALASLLAHRGVRRNDSVGIRLERSADLLASILAVLKTGARYVPLDLALPRQRVAFMLDDAEARCLITKRGLGIDPSPWPGRRIVLDRESSAEEPLKANAPAPERPLPNDVACIFYTSGSTGNPKGVMLTHRGVVNHLVGTYTALGVDPNDVILQVPSAAFDMSLRDTLGPLIHGARVVLLSESQFRNPAEIVSTIEAQNVTAILGVVPSLLSVLVDTVSVQGARMSNLRLVAAGGETFSPDLARKTLQILGEQVRLYNCYGPTEGTAISTAYRIRDVPTNQTTIPIGHPLPNVTVYVLDRSLRPAGIGIPGELYLGGPGVAVGYLNRPELSAERFVRSPFNQDAILCKTGDLGRWLADGELEFLGRVDRQIKLRGYRIEPGEIEAALREHTEVRQAVVAMHEPPRGEHLLVAYVVSDENPSELSESLRNHLRERLPPHMLPSRFVFLGELPRTTRGKVDWAALPTPTGASPSRAESHVEPGTPFERAIVAIWREVLHIDRIGIHDDFFELGGHSLSLMRVAAAIDREFGVRPSIRVLYEAPTVEGQSVAVLRECNRLRMPEDEECDEPACGGSSRTPV